MDGWCAFVLKEKLKLLKKKLKEQNKMHCGNLDNQISKAKAELELWDLKGEEAQLSDVEVAARMECMVNIRKLSHMRCFMLWQKGRVQWLQVGDANSRFFHGCINKRRRRKDILCLNFGGVRVEGMEQLKCEIMDHFRKHFQHRQWERPVLNNMVFKQVDVDANNALAEPFQLEEILAAVWDCESSKSLGPDGVNFGFKKEFW